VHELLQKVTQNYMMNTIRILIIDDETDIGNIFKLALESSDGSFKVDAFTDPNLALSNYKPGFYDLIMLDMHMPQMNGFEVHKKIKNIDRKAKVCFITASEPYYENSRREDIAILDKDLIIEKPISIEELEKQVNKILERSNSTM
jgi:DNA-binding response OmpR family regulator